MFDVCNVVTLHTERQHWQKQACCIFAVNKQISEAAEKLQVGPPTYQTEEGVFKLDLSCLGNTNGLPDTTPQAVRSIDLHNDQWPEYALQQLTTLDKSQLWALQVMLACVTG